MQSSEGTNFKNFQTEMNEYWRNHVFILLNKNDEQSEFVLYQ